MCLTFKDETEAQVSLEKHGITGMRIIAEPAMGDRVKPVVMCEFESDAERVLAMGYDARLINEYAAD